MNLPVLVGVDGCKAGWLAVIKSADTDPQIAVFAEFSQLLQRLGPEAFIAVDMPIGLPDQIGAGGRGPEKAIRPLLGRRKSSVFSIPSRSAVYAELSDRLPMAEKLAAHRRACIAARNSSSPPKGVAIQAFGIFPKIREIDALITLRLQHHVRETHPELVFWRLNGGRSLETPKNGLAGMTQRRQLLLPEGFSLEFLLQKPPKGATADDLLDGCACLATAARMAAGKAEPHPAEPVFDEKGLQIAIWA